MAVSEEQFARLLRRFLGEGSYGPPRNWQNELAASLEMFKAVYGRPPRWALRLSNYDGKPCRWATREDYIWEPAYIVGFRDTLEEATEWVMRHPHGTKFVDDFGYDASKPIVTGSQIMRMHLVPEDFQSPFVQAGPSAETPLP